jgi:hypothetical protein
MKSGYCCGAKTPPTPSQSVPEATVPGQPALAAPAATRGSVVAFSANKRKSLSSIYLPPMAETPAAAQGYQGHDDFAVIEGSRTTDF